MNVIIRLQNLPWSANATDIRQFFKGCQIPEGGVHIVGGENGDAFIAFSTDEDARQAMQLNGGKLKEVQVSLLLSSRAEMQKVIEKARQATTTPFMAKMIAQPTVLSAATIANQFAKKMPDMAAVPVPQPPVISLTNFLTQSMQQQNSGGAAVTQPQHMMPAYQTMQTNSFISGLTTPAALGIQQQKAAAAAAAYANYYASMMDQTGMNNANQMNAVKQPETPPKSFNADPRNRRSNSREQSSYRRGRSRSQDRKSSRRSRSSSRERYADSDRDGKDSGSKRRTRFSAAATGAPIASTMQPNMNKPAPGYLNPPPASSNIWEHPPPHVFASEKPLKLGVNSNFGSVSAYQGYNNGNSLPARNYQTENNNYSTSSSAGFGDIGSCIKVSNVDNDTFYSDLRKFFAGLQIGNNDIKFVTDSKGNRTGIVLIRFISSDSKKKALTKSMWQLKSTQVMITSITEEDFDTGLNNPKTANRQNNYKNDDRHGSRNDRHRDRSNSRDRDYPRGGGFNRNDGNKHNRFDDRPNYNRDNRQDNRDQGGNFRRDQNNDRNQRNFKIEEPPAKTYEPDENYTVLIIDDIPRTANEPDICEAFPNIVSMAIEHYTAYVKFTTHEVAKVTLENRFIHYIRNKRVFLEAGSDAQFNDIVRKNGKFDNPEVITIDGDENSSEAKVISETNDDNSRDSSRNSRDQKPFESRDQKPFESRDPRQRNFNNDRFQGGNNNANGNGQQQSMMKTDCVIIKNMEPGTSIEDVEFFFKDIGIYKMRVHILLDKQGKPCGDCFVEFKFPNDSQRAITKTNQMMKQNRVQVMLIPREQVEAVLSSFGGDDGNRPSSRGDDKRPNQNRPSRDWAPPNDFGSPGCVLMLSNLCYRASIDDILAEFREFDLHPDQLIRRFNDNGQPTGNACINFNSREDADLALEKYNSVKVLNRPVWLKRI